jgi:two-component system, sensor histidine kinase and response regulator
VNVATSSILNLEELLTRVDDDRELVVELFFIFRSGCPGNFQRLREAIRREDGKAAERECHTFKGILLNLSAPRAATAVRELENLVRKRQFASMKIGLAELESEVQLLLAQIDERAGEFRP